MKNRKSLSKLGWQCVLLSFVSKLSYLCLAASDPETTKDSEEYLGWPLCLTSLFLSFKSFQALNVGSWIYPVVAIVSQSTFSPFSVRSFLVTAHLLFFSSPHDSPLTSFPSTVHQSWNKSIAKLPDCLPRWLYHFECEPTITEGFLLLHILARFRQIRVLYTGYFTRGTRVSSKALMTFIISKSSAGHSIVARD